MYSVEEIKKVNMLLYGFDEDSNPLSIGSDLSNLAVDLAKVDLPENNVKLRSLSKFRLQRNAKDYLDSKIKVCKVKYYGSFAEYKLVGKIVEGVEGLAQLYNSLARDISPFKLPVKYIYDSQLWELYLFMKQYMKI